MVATDGKRLHLSEMDPGMFDDDIQPLLTGLYEVIAKSAKYIVIARNDEEDIKYPQWQQLLQDRDPEYYDIVTSRSISRLGIRTGQLLATDFAIEACGLGHGFKKDEDVAIEYSPCPNGGGFLITHELGKAIVMPLRMHDMSEAPPKDDAQATPHIPGLEPAGDVAETPEPPVEQAVKKAVRKMQSDLKKHGASVTIVNPQTGKGVEIAANNITPIK
jgi:hypothetical protein